MNTLAKDIALLDLESSPALTPDTVITSAPRTPSRQRTVTSLNFIQDFQQATGVVANLHVDPVKKNGAGGAVKLTNESAKPSSSKRKLRVSPTGSWEEEGAEDTEDVSESEMDIDDDTVSEEEDLPDEDVGT
jgi:hypothetical protein